ncbi:MAG: M1 family metallopeptidase [Gemmatimonadota bacterium]
MISTRRTFRPRAPGRIRGLFESLAAVLLLPGVVAAQNVRPTPGPVVPPPFYTAAVEAGTRALDGRPGPAMWTNEADYRLAATLNPDNGRLEGRVRIAYANNSPDSLSHLMLHLHQNVHAQGAVRNERLEVTGGMVLGAVRWNGAEVARNEAPAGEARYRVQGTLLRVDLPDPLLPGTSGELEVEWTNVVPQNGAGRMGHSRRELYFLAYWFPRMALYDDLRGCDAEPYLGNAEFYDGFGDYQAELTVPAGWTLMATGELTNPADVYAATTLERLAAAAVADTVVTVATAEEVAEGRVTREGVSGLLTYRFEADRVRDFTWTTSRAQRWDATSAQVGDDRVAIHAFWRPGRAPLWRDQVRYAKHAIEFHSRFTDFPYPWSHMTSVEGADIIDGGMEFPMLTLIGPYEGRQAQDLYNVTSHELGHMWIPMIVGTNEKRYAWMDEGTTTFLENQSRYEYWPGTDAHSAEREGYLALAREGGEEPLMRHGDYYSTVRAYGIASYSKPATLLVTLRNMLGEEIFLRGYRAFIRDWAWLHPAPWDFFNAFEREAGVELDWFWQSYYYETWSVDPAVASVVSDAGSTVIRIEDRGFGPVPLRVQVQFESGNVVEREVRVDPWLDGEQAVEIRLPAAAGRVNRVQLDPRQLVPDLDRDNNTWPR